MTNFEIIVATLLTLGGVWGLFITVEWMAVNAVFIGYVPEGAIVCVKTGDKAERFAGSIKGHVVGKTSGKIYADGDAIPPEDNPCWVIPFIGAIWIGIPPFASFHKRHFKWIKVDSANEKRVIRDEETVLLIWQYTYGMKFSQTTNDLIPVDILLDVTLRTVDANASLFGVHDYLTAITGRVQGIVRDHIGDFTYEVIIESRRAGKTTAPASPTRFDEELMLKAVFDLTSTTPLFGQVISMVTLPGISSPNDAKIAEAAQKALEKKQDAEALIKVQVAQTAVEKEATRTEEQKLRKSKVTAKRTLVDADAMANATKLTGKANADVEGMMAKAIEGTTEEVSNVLVAKATRLPPKLRFLTQSGSNGPAPTVMVNAESPDKNAKKEDDKKKS